MTTSNDQITGIAGTVTISNLGDDPRPELYERLVRRYLSATYPGAHLSLQFGDIGTEDKLRVFVGGEQIEHHLSESLPSDCYTEYVGHPDHDALQPTWDRTEEEFGSLLPAPIETTLYALADEYGVPHGAGEKYESDCDVTITRDADGWHISDADGLLTDEDMAPLSDDQAAELRTALAGDTPEPEYTDEGDSADIGGTVL